MAKGTGSTRASKWAAPKGSNEPGLFYRNGYRVEYSQLSEKGKKAVITEKNRIANELYQKVKNETVSQFIENKTRIDIHFTKKGIEHLCNDAMLTLSGKYFSGKTMMNMKEILSDSVFVPSNHGLSHQRTDGRNLWFKYKDGDGRGVFFKVTWNKNIKKYELYSVTDKI